MTPTDSRPHDDGAPLEGFLPDDFARFRTERLRKLKDEADEFSDVPVFFGTKRLKPLENERGPTPTTDPRARRRPPHAKTQPAEAGPQAPESPHRPHQRRGDPARPRPRPRGPRRTESRRLRRGDSRRVRRPSGPHPRAS